MNSATRFLMVALVFSVPAAWLFAADDVKKQEPRNRPARGGQSFPTLVDDAAWFWFPGPKAVYHEGKHKRTYFGWVNRAGNICAGCYDHESKETTKAILKKNLNPDSHSVPSLLVRPDGRLIAFYARHYQKEATFYRISKGPEDISAWGAEMKVDTNGGYSDFTNAVQLSEENDTIYLFRRGDNLSTSGDTVSGDTVHWSPAKQLMERRWPRRGHTPYLKVASNGNDTIHLALVDCGPVDSTGGKSSIYYSCYRGGKFRKADGSTITDMGNLPIKPAEADMVYDGNASGFSAWLGDIAVNQAGNPVILYHVYVTYCKDGLSDLRYRHARWDGKRWRSHEITRAPSTRFRSCYPTGGMTLDHADPSIVYLAREIRGVYEIEKWTTPDGGATWVSERITSGSSKDNLRPVVPHGHKQGDVGLIWMYGDYMNTKGARYGDYDTVFKFN